MPVSARLKDRLAVLGAMAGVASAVAGAASLLERARVVDVVAVVAGLVGAVAALASLVIRRRRAARTSGSPSAIARAEDPSRRSPLPGLPERPPPDRAGR